MLNEVEQKPKFEFKHKRHFLGLSAIASSLFVLSLFLFATTYGIFYINKEEAVDEIDDVGVFNQPLNWEFDKNVDDGVTIVIPGIIKIAEVEPIELDLSKIIDPYVNNGGRVSVSFSKLSDGKVFGMHNEHEVFVSASTYKLFTAYSVLKRVEEGVFTWQDQNIYDNQNLEACFDNMMIYSDNNCAEAFMDKIGYAVVGKEARDIGCAETTFISNDGYTKTSAGDLSLLLTKIYNGEILKDKSNVNRLFYNMKRNIYRSGIPNGVSGEVANKPGFIDGYLNDAAIVFGETSDYVLVILTQNSSWYDIAEIASQIEAIYTNQPVD